MVSKFLRAPLFFDDRILWQTEINQNIYLVAQFNQWLDDWWLMTFTLDELDEDDSHDTDRYRRTDEIDDKMYIKWQHSFDDIDILDDRRLGKY